MVFILASALWGVVAPAATRGGEPTATRDQIDFFAKQVRPLLTEHCYPSHSVQSKRLEAKLLLDSRKGHVVGGESGPALVPGDAQNSLLIEAVRL